MGPAYILLLLACTVKKDVTKLVVQTIGVTVIITLRGRPLSDVVSVSIAISSSYLRSIPMLLPDAGVAQPCKRYTRQRARSIGDSCKLPLLTIDIVGTAQHCLIWIAQSGSNHLIVSTLVLSSPLLPYHGLSCPVLPSDYELRITS